MWSYYGSKSKIVHLYPPPKYGKIIEPFAGSARYSLKYWDRDVLLVDKYTVITDTWKYLQSCSKDDILKLPILCKGDNILNYNLSEQEKNLLGFIVVMGSTGNRKAVGTFGEYGFKRQISNIANNLFKIKHWHIVNDTYTNIENQEATWFIDPPYEFGGEHYKESSKNIDFVNLANWCKERQGQAIVCENTKATWMDFKPMKDMQGSMFKATEAIWSNMPTNYDNTQSKLF